MIKGAASRCKQVARYLDWDDSTTDQHVKDALRLGYLINDTIRPRQPAQLHIGNPIKEVRVEVLPTVDQVRAKLAEG
jgi:hypothetical protein